MRTFMFGRLRAFVRGRIARPLLAATLAVALATPALAQQEVKIGIGFGIGFLPTFILDDMKLVEKHAKAEGLDLKASYPRFSGSAAMQDAVLSGSVDVGVYGVQAMLIAWEKAKGTPQQIIGIAGVTSLPLVLVTNQKDVKTLKDFKQSDRIAMPALVSPQMYALQLAAQKVYGADQYDKLKPLVVSLPHPEALNQLLSGKTEVTAYFSSAPFTQIALKNPNIHTVLTSTDAFGGKASFLVAGATKKVLDANPKLAVVLTKALAEAQDVIKNDPKKAAEIYLKVEPSKTLDNAAVEAILKELKDDFDVSVHGVGASAKFMAQIGQLKSPPASWKDAFVPSLHNTQSD
ncbi:MAG TPA: ABC transporter substrate-binding protein [Alphaproteobacteria bacterium]|jgi:NitT/TauT family transport system substrate-binding protein|nr:ABC transporter substrate-binding protein [Alphaproteobacteria bacterium]